MGQPVLLVHAVRYPKSDWLGFLTGALIRLLQGTPYEHVYPEIQYEGVATGWNIKGWFRTWARANLAKLATYHTEVQVFRIPLTQEQAEGLLAYWDGLVERHYGVGRMLLIPLWNLTGWRWIARLAGVTCTGALAEGLQRVGLWGKSEPSMADLVIVQSKLLELTCIQDSV